jgi:hypothetical protein
VRLDGVRTVDIDGHRIKLRELSRGDTITLTFDVPQKTIHRVIGDIPYKLTVHGSNVTSIDPKGVVYPLFEPATTGETVTKTRYVPEVGSLVW